MEFPQPNPPPPGEPRRDIPATIPPSAASTPAPDPAARFRKPEPAPVAAPAPRAGLPGPVWFVLGAVAASAVWYGYGLMQRAMAKSMAGALTAASPGLTTAVEDPSTLKFLEQARETANQMSARTGAAPQGGSGLDFVSGPAGGASGGQAAQGQPMEAPISQAQINAVGQAGANMVDSIMPLLASPAMIKSLSPEKQKELQTLTAALMHMQDSLRTGKPVDRRAQADMFSALQKIQAEAASKATSRPMVPAAQGERP